MAEWGAAAVRGVQGTHAATGVWYLTVSLASWRQARQREAQMVLSREVLGATAQSAVPGRSWEIGRNRVTLSSRATAKGSAVEEAAVKAMARACSGWQVSGCSCCQTLLPSPSRRTLRASASLRLAGCAGFGALVQQHPENRAARASGTWGDVAESCCIALCPA